MIPLNIEVFLSAYSVDLPVDVLSAEGHLTVAAIDT